MSNQTQAEWDRLHGSQYEAEEAAQADLGCQCKNNEDYCEHCQRRIERSETLKRGEEMQLEALATLLNS